MSESVARDDLDRLRQAGYAPRAQDGGTVVWVCEKTGDIATLDELAAWVVPHAERGYGWLTPRLAEAARLALGQP